jgi:aminoglycoside/choline kinase family phosphotransferase
VPVTFSREPLERLARSLSSGPVSIVEMPGGASLRRFFRVHVGGQNAVGMFFPDALASEEAGNDAPNGARWPFLEVRDLLQSRGVDVPALLAEDCPEGWILVEDLGIQTLADALLRRPERRTELYRRIVLDLGRAHDALVALPESSVVSRRAFEVDLLEWEVDHFREWGLEARGFHLNDDQRRTFQRLSRSLAERVRALPYGFTHRDFQSRNLMVVPRDDGERVAWVDFQDAMMGPRVYDLVALLGDSYQTFSDDFVRERLGD